MIRSFCALAAVTLLLQAVPRQDVIVRTTTPVGRAWGHSGFFPGYQTERWHFPDAGVTLAIQINSSAPRSGPRGLFDIAPMVKQ